MQNSHSTTSSLLKEGIFLVNGRSAYGKSSSSRFSLSAARNAVIKATQYVTFGFSFRVLVFFLPSRKVWTSPSISVTDFSVLAAIIRENSHKLPWIENGEGFAVHSSNLTEGCERRLTCQQLISDIKYTWENMVFIRVCCYGVSRGWKSLYNTVVCMNFVQKKKMGEKENWSFEENVHLGSGWFTFCFEQYQTKTFRFLKHLNDLEHPTNYL